MLIQMRFFSETLCACGKTSGKVLPASQGLSSTWLCQRELINNFLSRLADQRHEFETGSLPRSLDYPGGLTFYVADPISSIH